MTKKIAIFGGSGFIGSHLTQLLSSGDNDVFIYDIVEPATIPQHCTYEYLDIRNEQNTYDFLSNFDYVYILSALLGKGCSNEPANGWNTNIKGVGHLIYRMAQLPSKPVVIFSSSAMVYDNFIKTVPIKEISALSADSIYDHSKLIGESLLKSCYDAFGLRSIAFRFFTVYGQGPASFEKGHFIPTWIHQAKTNNELLIYDDGHQTIDLTHVDDVSKALGSILDLSTDSITFEIFNIGTGIETKVTDISTWFKKAKPELGIRYVPEKTILPKRKCADIQKASDRLGFKPSIQPEQGILNLLKQVL